MTVQIETLRRRREVLAAARAVMWARLADPDLDLGDVAEAVGCSARQLQRVFAGHADADFRTTLLRLRMQRARRLLERGHSVRSICLRVGYRGPSGLVAAFKRVYSVPPSAVQPRTPEYLGDWSESP